MSLQNDIHVVPYNGSWAVKPSGSDRTSSVHDTRDEAVAEGRRLALRDHVALVTHGPDGRIVQSLEVEVHRLPERFGELIASADSATEITVTDGGVPRARLLPLAEADIAPAAPQLRILGLHPGSVLWMAEDFDEPLPAEFWLGGDA